MHRSPFPSAERLRRGALALVAAALLLAACGGGSSNGSITTVTRPYTNAKLAILSPTPGEVTGPNVMLRFQVTGATISSPSKVRIVPNEGHIHVSIDGRLITMAYTSSTEVFGLSPGLHTLLAQFVANDHLPFADPVKAICLFTVKG